LARISPCLYHNDDVVHLRLGGRVDNDEDDGWAGARDRGCIIEDKISGISDWMENAAISKDREWLPGWLRSCQGNHSQRTASSRCQSDAEERTGGLFDLLTLQICRPTWVACIRLQEERSQGLENVPTLGAHLRPVLALSSGHVSTQVHAGHLLRFDKMLFQQSFNVRG
jgi:hypothetical protein